MKVSLDRSTFVRYNSFMKKIEFISTIGYQGNAALVSTKLIKMYKGLTLEQLVEKGYYRAAVASVLFDKASDKEQYLVDVYNKHSSVAVRNFAHLQRVYGVPEPPEKIGKIQKIKG